jgi:hypothetical protein
LYSLPIYLHGSKGFCSSTPPIKNMVPLCNRWWDHVGCKWYQVATNHMLIVSSLRMWELQKGGVMRKTLEKNVSIVNHPKYKSWWSHYDEGHLLVPMQILQWQEGVMAKGGVVKLKQIVERNPTFLGKNFKFFSPFYMIHILPLEQSFTHKKMLIQRYIWNKISI